VVLEIDHHTRNAVASWKVRIGLLGVFGCGIVREVVAEGCDGR
jgi:hypothetical protein